MQENPDSGGGPFQEFWILEGSFQDSGGPFQEIPEKDPSLSKIRKILKRTLVIGDPRGADAPLGKLLFKNPLEDPIT